MIKSICVYCGSSSGIDPGYGAAAREMGQTLADQGVTLVYGGGKVGLMGLVADAALAAGGRVVGVIPELLMNKEVGHRGLSQLHVVPDMHQRKKMMADLADGFVAMPGGAGTYEELFEVFTWAQLGYHGKPIGLLNVLGYFDPLVAMLQHTVRAGFMNSGYVDMLLKAGTPAQLLERMAEYQPPVIDKWSVRRQAV